jgi:transposase
MSLRLQPVPQVPEETARVARAALPHGNIYIKMRDEWGTIFTDEDFIVLFSSLGQSAIAPWQLALVTIMQYVENLSDRQAADAVRSRIDWKYALSLELTDPGFDNTVLSEFRTRLVSGSAEQKVLDLILEKRREHKLIKARGRQRIDSTHVLARVRAVNRLECVGETMRHALNRKRLAQMGRPYCQPSMANKRLPGCVRFLLSRHSDECGYNNSTPRPVSCAGEKKRKAFHRPPFLSARRMTVMRVTPKSIQPLGSDTRFI